MCVLLKQLKFGEDFLDNYTKRANSLFKLLFKKKILGSFINSFNSWA